MRRLVMMGAVGLAIGCTRVEEVRTESFDATGVTQLVATVQSGNVHYTGGGERSDFDVQIIRWGRGSTRGRATARQETAMGRAQVDGERFLLDAIAGRRAGVDFNIVGPSWIDTDIRIDDGVARLDGVQGFHVVQADGIVGREVVGEGDFQGDGRVDLRLSPYFDGAFIVVESLRGDVRLGLPYGLDYDLTVEFDPDEPAAVEDLGFDSFVPGQPGLIIGRRGFRDVRIDVYALRGSVEIYGY